MIETLAGTIALITSFIGLLPQVFKTLKTKSTQDLSMLMLINYSICSIAWIIYSGYISSMFVFFSNVVGLVTSLILIFQKKYFDARYK